MNYKEPNAYVREDVSINKHERDPDVCSSKVYAY